ncbi:MAG: hypothetical protein ABSE95_06565 [Thermodesulfobacteriota bacterium]
MPLFFLAGLIAIALKEGKKTKLDEAEKDPPVPDVMKGNTVPEQTQLQLEVASARKCQTAANGS